MFHVGEFFREIYQGFFVEGPLAEQYYARSSGSRRCLESVSAMLTGFFGGGTKNDSVGPRTDYDRLANYWQPLPVYSSFPKGFDSLLDENFPCPNADHEWDEVMANDYRINKLLSTNKPFLKEISSFAGERIYSLKNINELYQELYIESQHDYHWWNQPYGIWTVDYETYAISELRQLSAVYWSIKYSSR